MRKGLVKKGIKKTGHKKVTPRDWLVKMFEGKKDIRGGRTKWGKNLTQGRRLKNEEKDKGKR